MSLSKIRNRDLFLADLVAFVVAPLAAFAIQGGGLGAFQAAEPLLLPYVALTAALRVVTLYAAGLYRRLWRHASVGEVKQLLLAIGGCSLVGLVVGMLVVPRVVSTGNRVGLVVVMLDAFLTGSLISIPRLLARLTQGEGRRRHGAHHGRPVLIVGAGDTAKLIAKELFSAPQLGLDPIGFVDDDVNKHRQMLCDLPILGPLSSIQAVVERFNVAELIIAMPSASGEVIRKVVRAALDCGIPTRTVPSMHEIISRHGGSTALREVEIQDLLRRDPIQTDLAAVAELATRETVLITGAGGSIGSELCRQLARLAPARLVVLGHGENSIFDIYQELTQSFPEVPVVPVIADVRDRKRIMGVFQQYRPHAVFHAAAHKHVPLMEGNVTEAITNNVAGTRNVVDAAVEAGAEHLVFISTDKAVRPSSVMGATKRVAEGIVQHAAMRYGRNFVSVRFGNVLGSRGSVVPIFLRQIRAGGPITVTHPEMRRYFMTIPEAVQLVLQAGALGRGGEVFVLDMGQQVRIVDIATDLVRLSGLEVGTDIEIQFTGMRPGEKLFEETFFTSENVLPTDHPKVLRVRSGLLADGMAKRLESLVVAAEASSSDEELRQLLQPLVPDFRPQGANEEDARAARRPATTVPSVSAS